MKDICPFCDISKEEIVLKESAHAFVILSNPRVMEGHLLVIPKRHVLNINKLRKEEWQEITDLLVEFENKILEKLSSGCDIRQHFKPFAKGTGTHVDHLHFHLFPRNLNDQLYRKAEKFKGKIYKSLSKKEKDKLSKLLF
jgi:diadenosine tetraphosphate (Ap4A) HIT family hydrolase